MKVASLDLGSNTFLLLIAEVSGGQVKKIISDHLEVVRLGQGVHQNRSFHPDALKRARECLTRYKKIIDQENVDCIKAVATSAARDVVNKDEFFKIASDLEIPLEVISGAREAQMTYRGAVFDLPQEVGTVVVDVGGGSTEIIGQAEDGALFGSSLDVGSVRLTEMFVKGHPIDGAVIDSLRFYIKNVFQQSKVLLPQKALRLVAVAGTPTTLACVDQKISFNEDRVHKYKISKKKLSQWVEKLSNMTLAERVSLVGMDPKRADVIPVGAMILEAAIEHLGAQEFLVSTKGVRFGLAIDLAGDAR